jgi:hypothetical protein
MSRISQDFINSVGYLYEEINTQQNDFLNEESEYYDAEMAHVVEDILLTVSVSMIYEGYSASAVIGFLADSSEQDILEKYLSFDENILTESKVSEDYIEEQLELLESRLGAAWKLFKAAGKTLVGRGPGYAATKIAGPRAPGLIDKSKVVISKGVQKVKDIAKGAKAALTSPTAKGIAKGAATFGLGAAGGYMGAKMAGAGAPTSSNAPAPNKPATSPTTPKSNSSAPAAPSKGPKASSAAVPAKPKSSAAKPGETPMQQWARLYPNLAAKVKPGQSGYEEISQTRVKPGPYEKKDQTPTTGPQSAQIDTKQVEDAIKAAQEKQKKSMEQQKNAMTAKESYEPYDIVLNYLLSEGHADTLDEANYIMMEMDENAIGTIIEHYEDYLLAEEISEWVDGLLEEGYDFSKYTWDDIVEYYVSEAKYGTVKGRKKLAKKVRAGKDVGKKGSGFEKIVKKASSKYGKERATKIAAAAMWKNLGK